jgi:hypothetical protein
MGWHSPDGGVDDDPLLAMGGSGRSPSPFVELAWVRGRERESFAIPSSVISGLPDGAVQSDCSDSFEDFWKKRWCVGFPSGLLPLRFSLPRCVATFLFESPATTAARAAAVGILTVIEGEGEAGGVMALAVVARAV